ncbi:hypothetical protein ACV33H_33330, partial [Pseudomonas aeruginosa]
TITDQLKELCAELSGTSVDCRVSCNGQVFRENLLFTHRGLSGPAIPASSVGVYCFIGWETNQRAASSPASFLWNN